MKRYAPNSLDLAPRDVVARSIEQEILEGRAYDQGYVHLDLTHLGGDRIKERLPGIRQIAMDFAGVDPIEKPVPIQPGQHYSMGGIDVDKNGATKLPGLFAAGECSCISVHGANRLGGNSLLETVVFGRLVADKIIEEIQNVKKPETEPVLAAVKSMENKIETILMRDGGENFFYIKSDLTLTMQEKYGIFRDHDTMEEGLSEIEKLKERFAKSGFNNKEPAYNQALIQFLELESMLKIAEVVAVGAIERKESRGSHKRNDYPDRDDENFLKHSIVNLKDGELIINYKPVKLGMFKPKERVY
jgi:succinate dehydrogenase / fumarate reductase, flavoprotein subunit